MKNTLRVGLWLGTENKIEQMWQGRGGWWHIKDTTGEVYRQRETSSGLRATPEIEPDSDKRPIVPWPDKGWT